jgi:PAS domain S-box-containing protein
MFLKTLFAVGSAILTVTGATALSVRIADARQWTGQIRTILIFGSLLCMFIVIAAGWVVRQGSSGRGLVKEALRKNIIPEGFAERLIADDLRSAEDALAQQIGTGIELIGPRKDGSNFPIEIMLSPLESAEGILVTAAIRDIRVRKAAEVHLGQMEGRYRGLLEAAPDAMVVVNESGEIVLLNVQAEKQFGYRRDELVGQPLHS